MGIEMAIRLSRRCSCVVTYDGQPSQEAIERFIAVLSLQADLFPHESELEENNDQQT